MFEEILLATVRLMGKPVASVLEAMVAVAKTTCSPRFKCMFQVKIMVAL
jgi:hypothetical protein